MITVDDPTPTRGNNTPEPSRSTRRWSWWGEQGALGWRTGCQAIGLLDRVETPVVLFDLGGGIREACAQLHRELFMPQLAKHPKEFPPVKVGGAGRGEADSLL